uniref:Uncharacterized protein n=1 Tax=Hucho hucho TaxID=62062 RepID=A0A4W5KYU1_9TELE
HRECDCVSQQHPSSTLLCPPSPDRLIGLPEGRARNHNRPQVVPALSDVFIQDVAVGAEHTLVLSSTGDVFTWGSNSEGQLGLGHTNHVREPTLVTSLQGKDINQISAGRCHSAAWTAPSVPPRAPGKHTHTHTAGSLSTSVVNA